MVQQRKDPALNGEQRMVCETCRQRPSTPERCCRVCVNVDENEDGHREGGARCCKYGEDIPDIDEYVCPSFTDDPLLKVDRND